MRQFRRHHTDLHAVDGLVEVDALVESDILISFDHEHLIVLFSLLSNNDIFSSLVLDLIVTSTLFYVFKPSGETLLLEVFAEVFIICPDNLCGSDA